MSGKSRNQRTDYEIESGEARSERLSATEMPWPTPSDIAFGTKTSRKFNRRTIANVGWLLTRPELGTRADAFRKAADMVVAGLSEGKYDPFSCDVYFFPIAYLYRHAIELSLKEAIGYGIRLSLIQHSPKLDKILNGHNLYVLWNKLKPALQQFWPNAETDSLRAAERIISQFHKIDKTGQAFRYPAERDGSPTVDQNSLELVDLEQLSKVSAGLCTFLDGCISGFDDALSSMSSDAWW